MKLNKRGAADLPARTTGELILFVAVVLASAFIVVKLITVLGFQGGTESCYINTLLNAHLKEPVSGKSTIEWVCPINGPIKLDKKDLDEQMNSYVPPASRSAYEEEGLVDDRGVFGSDQEKAKYNVEKFVAAQLKSCHIKSGFGEIELFDNYWDLTGFSRSQHNLLDYLREKGWKDDQVPAGCGICTVFYLEDEALELFGANTEIDPDTYLQRHPHTIGSSISYWEFIDMPSQISSYGASKDFSFSVADATIENPLAITLVRLPSFQGANLAENAADNLGVAGGILGFFAGGYKGLIAGAIVGNGLDWLGVDEFSDESLNELGRGETFLAVVPVKDLDNHCTFIPNSFSDKNLETVWTTVSS